MRYFSFLFLFLFPILAGAQEFKTLFRLNSPARETNMSITPNGKYLFFMSTRGGQPWSRERNTNEADGVTHHDGDIWYSVKEDGEWQPPRCMDGNINTYDGEDEPNITVDGQTVYFQSWRDDWRTTGGPYYRADLDGVVWENPVGMGDEINRFFQELEARSRKTLIKDLREKDLYGDYLLLLQEGSEDWDKQLAEKGIDVSGDYKLGTDGMTVSPDQKTFVVSAFVPEKKKYDLFISRKNEDGIWAYPKPLDISSEGNEISVFIAGDNKTLYFASDRKGGYGGYDIYKITLKGGTASTEPDNLGPPYNTEKDEYGFIVNSTEDTGFMIIDGDIVQVDLNAEAKPEETIVINGRVVDEEGNPLQASVELVNLSKGESMSKARSNNYSGEYSFSYAREEGRYNQVVTTPEGIVVEEPFEVVSSTGNTLEFLIVIKKEGKDEAQIVGSLSKGQLKKGEVFRVDKLQFEADKSVIEDESYPILDQIAAILLRRPGVTIEIGGHTNGLPPHDYCDKLSTERAQAVTDYLAEKGVPKARLQFKGYGKRQPIESNATLQGRKVNQRVEIKILDVGD